MRRILASTVAVFLMMAAPVSAQMMFRGQDGATAATAASTAQEEQKGADILAKLQAKSVSCSALTDDDFDLLGDYFMGQMTGTSHAQMNQAMTLMMGEEGERRMHIVLGRRLSGCGGEVLPAQGAVFLPMMGGMMGAAWPAWGDRTYGAANAAPSWPLFAGFWITAFLVWALLIVAIVAVLKWISKQKK